MPTVHSKIQTIILLSTLLLVCSLDMNRLLTIGDEEHDGASAAGTMPPAPPKDIYAEIYGTYWFKHYSGVSELLFDYIYEKLGFNVTEARNIHFEYSAADNVVRRRQPGKISVANRILAFLHQMRTGDLVWETSRDHRWAKSSASDDFFHVLQHFVATFDPEWIREMTDGEKDISCLFDGYPTAYQAADGSHFHRRRSTNLPEGIRRRELYLYKHKYPEGQNVQAVVNHFGVATQVVSGVPGGMSDSAACVYICQNDRPNSTLVDGGYPRRLQFVNCDGSTDHSAARGVVERYFGRLKLLWGMVGNKYCRGSRWHSMVIRAAFILTNMVIVFDGGLNQ